jgi:hypothetical protein
VQNQIRHGSHCRTGRRSDPCASKTYYKRLNNGAAGCVAGNRGDTAKCATQKTHTRHTKRNGGDAQQSTKTHGDTSGEGAGRRSVESRWGRDGDASDGRCDDEVTQPRNEKEIEAPPGRHGAPHAAVNEATAAHDTRDVGADGERNYNTGRREEANEAECKRERTNGGDRVDDNARGRGGANKAQRIQPTDDRRRLQRNLSRNAHAAAPNSARAVAGRCSDSDRVKTIGTDTARSEQEN